MQVSIFCVFLVAALEVIVAEIDYAEYYSDDDEDYINPNQREYKANEKSTSPPPLFKDMKIGDMKIDQIPICNDDPDNVDCGNVYIKIKDLENREKIYMKDVGYLNLDYATEDNGIHSLVYSGEGDVTAYITYFGNTIVGTIHREDGKIKKIMSISDQKQVMSLIDVPNSIKTEDDEDDASGDPLGDANDVLDLNEKRLLLIGKEDSNSIAKVTVTVYYNKEAEKQMMAVPPEVYIRSLINEVNHGYRKSNVPIKFVLHAFELTDSKMVSDDGLGKACNKALDALKKSEFWEMMDDRQIGKKCQKKMVGQFRKCKGTQGGFIEQAERVRMGANMAVLLVHEIPGRPEFCGRASKLFDITRNKMNLALVSISGGCEFTFGHELGHLLGLAHQKEGREENKYFSYGHGHRISRKLGKTEGTRTVMATSSGGYKKRLNVYSNPEVKTGTSDIADNARVLRETRYLAASSNNANENDMHFTIKIEQHTCQKSANCLPLSSCTDQMTPNTFLQKMCGDGKVCCEKSPGCVKKFPQIEQKQDGWFMFGNRQHNHTLSIGSARSDGTYISSVELMAKENKKQIWKWDGELLVSKWNLDYVYDGSVRPFIIAKRTGSIFQNWRFSDGFLVNLGYCSETIVVGGMSIARKWFRVEMDKTKIKNSKKKHKVSFDTYLCKQDETCTDIGHCHEAVSSASMKTKFCDKEKVCCKTKVCHNVKEFEGTETPVKGWFVLESQMNKMFLTVKSGTASDGQHVVNSSPRTDMQGQVWMWKDGYVVSQLDEALVLDGSFGKVSIKNKKHGNIYQKWRKSDGFFVNAGHCEVLDVALAKNEVSMKYKKFNFRAMPWSPSGLFMARVIRSGLQRR